MRIKNPKFKTKNAVLKRVLRLWLELTNVSNVETFADGETLFLT